jgi:hypothetical protein
MAFHADANSANGALHRTTDSLANGAQPIPGSRHFELRQSVLTGRFVRGPSAAFTPRSTDGSERERAVDSPTDRQLAPATQDARCGEWRLPAISRFLGGMALPPIDGSSATEFSQISSVEAVAPGPNDGNNAGKWRTASEGRARAQQRPTCNWRLPAI